MGLGPETTVPQRQSMCSSATLCHTVPHLNGVVFKFHDLIRADLTCQRINMPQGASSCIMASASLSDSTIFPSENLPSQLKP